MKVLNIYKKKKNKIEKIKVYMDKIVEHIDSEKTQ